MSDSNETEIYEIFKKNYMVEKKDEKGKSVWKLKPEFVSIKDVEEFLEFYEYLKEYRDQLNDYYIDGFGDEVFNSIYDEVKKFINDNKEKYHTYLSKLGNNVVIKINKYSEFIEKHFTKGKDGKLIPKIKTKPDVPLSSYKELVDEYKKLGKFTKREGIYMGQFFSDKAKLINLFNETYHMYFGSYEIQFEKDAETDPFSLKGPWNKFALAILIIIIIGSILFTIYAIVWLISLPWVISVELKEAETSTFSRIIRVLLRSFIGPYYIYKNWKLFGTVIPFKYE